MRMEESSLPLCESAVEKPGDDREVLALVVRGQDDRVLVAGLGSHFEDWSKDRSVAISRIRQCRK